MSKCYSKNVHEFTKLFVNSRNVRKFEKYSKVDKLFINFFEKNINSKSVHDSKKMSKFKKYS